MPTPTPLSSTVLAVGPVDAGSTIVLPFTAIVTATGLAFNLTGIAIDCLVKVYTSDPDSDALATLSVLNGGVIITNAAAGQGEAVVPPAATAILLGTAILVYAVRVYVSSTEVYDILTGTITVQRQAVQSTTSF